ncbi:MAG: CPBP family intramembrane metalloprotease [Acidobacteria bacterium]|uniref:CPBP family intramembrane metalloprotease n=1 Tax=Candidatus Polarisedimenticola svalbardensis TaxID=2886004 RepID=A0A8J7CDU4_9BACT|nr:CPBP family intramembrane metalloprotease [Candidatus Polarisedimenticola svalbardensis]
MNETDGRRPDRAPSSLKGWLLPLVAVLAAALFLPSLGKLWPLVDADVTRDPDELVPVAREFLESRGFDLDRFQSSGTVTVSGPLTYLESAFGKDQVQAWIRDGLPLVMYRIGFKKPGEPRALFASIHPNGSVISWRKLLEEDDPGPSITEDEARTLARAALVDGLGLDLSGWVEKTVAVTERPDRRDTSFVLERLVSEEPEFREQALAVVAGDQVIHVRRYGVAPGAARRAARAAEAPERAMQSIGFVLLGVAVVAGFWIFLTRLRDGKVRLARAALLAGFIFACLLATWLLQTGYLFGRWEPLWPRWVSSLQYLGGRAQMETWMTLVLLALIGAGDALDKESGAGRADSMWALFRGKVLDPAVGAASYRGFLVGLICGGVLTGGVLLLQMVVGAQVALQPRGFFFYALNSASPALSTLLFFLNVALLEELGYRFFAGAWLDRIQRFRWIAILVPAAIYGLTHTGLSFLPPAEPFWGRAVVMTLVGCVWGWAFFRYDALTVVLSHWTADLFIFNWPRISSGKTGLIVIAMLTIAVPLIPAVLGGVARLVRSSGPPASVRSR